MALSTALILIILTAPPDASALAAAKCLDCRVTTSSRLFLPETKGEAYEYKIYNPASDSFSSVTLKATASGTFEPADAAAIRLEESKAYLARYGILQKDLAARVEALPPDAELSVWLWLRKGPFEFVKKEEITGDPARMQAVATAEALITSQAISNVKAAILQAGGEILVEDGSPLLRAKLRVSVIAALALRQDIATIGIDDWPGRPTSAAWYNTINVSGASAYSTGSVTIATSEGCQPQNYSHLGTTYISNPNACSAWHEMMVAAAVHNTLSPPGADQNATVCIASWDQWNWGATSPYWPQYPDAVHWCRTKGVHIFNYSHDVGGSAPAGLDGWDFKSDYYAKFSPYDIWVLSAGNDNYAGHDTVSNKGYNGLVVGASDDHGTDDPANDTIATFSSWRNPVSTHNDYELPNVVAPGVNVDLILADNGNQPVSGTSFSAPFVAGCLGWAHAENVTMRSWPELSRALVMATATRNLSGQTAFTQLGAGGDRSEGVGLANCARLAYLAQPSQHVTAGSSAPNGWDYGSISFASDFTNNVLSKTWYMTAVSGAARLRAILTFDGTPGGCDSLGNCTSDVLDGDLDLVLYKKNANGTYYPYQSSNSYDSSWEGVDIAVSAGDQFQIKVVKGTTNASGTYMGVAWYQY